MRKISQGIMSFLEKAVVFFTVLFLILFALIFVLLLYFFGFAGFFFLFQVEYESLTVLLLYVIFVLLFGFVIDWIAKVFVMICNANVKNYHYSMIIKLFIEMMFAWVTLIIVDEMLEQVTVSIWLELLAASIMTLADFTFENKSKWKKKLSH
ncbi:hypothetical protein GCM10010978_08120 [Compostibacillus humi]|mgnify:CR=1 FL=1|uniref:Regulatory protein YrvL n=1 Tax=Compostibacillus humi TaxID=1245525 RepID=A0A8J2ZQJ3_9BACI|nr:YrvL family regulatory protein [Compostibacillus humi]GGH71810.1 hypothetical protein GCM10010978_08120 [Compostibacillus humi]HLT54904.1 YrvL family regulatory protein [Bacillota bacterium]